VDAAYRREQAADLFGDRQEALEQKLESGGSDLAALAAQYNLHTGEIKGFTHEGSSLLGTSPDLIKTAFSAEVADQGKLGGPIAMSADHEIIIHVTNHQRPAPRSLDSVRDAVTAAVRKDAGAKQALAAAEAASKQLAAGASFDATLKTLGVTAPPLAFVSRGDPTLPERVQETAFKAPHPATGKPAYLAVALDKGDAALIQLTAVKPGAAGTNPTADQQLADTYSRRLRSLELAGYMKELEKHTTVKRNPDALN
jgi:peptidyl-prolyl cis-trans isomerase D